MIPYGTQNLDSDDIQAVVDTLQSSYLTQGPQVANFELAIADYVQAQYAVATSSATAALHIACLALGLTKHDIGWILTHQPAVSLLIPCQKNFNKQQSTTTYLSCLLLFITVVLAVIWRR